MTKYKITILAWLALILKLDHSSLRIIKAVQEFCILFADPDNGKIAKFGRKIRISSLALSWNIVFQGNYAFKSKKQYHLIFFKQVSFQLLNQKFTFSFHKIWRQTSFSSSNIIKICNTNIEYIILYILYEKIQNY